ncbi:Protein-L-isoaspartate(D-aspartate) O-methyltransferase [Beggiatoa sp. PS]|nr:Protein-L-isoaspartate(D-aspartate) O-methyltransferase [Beggiatoa sp. PS]
MQTLYSRRDTAQLLRLNKIDSLIQQLRHQGIKNPEVLRVMRQTPRHLFIDEALANHAYTNNALPIGYGQTISQPYIVARMTEALLNHGYSENVLEVGTGCGYQTAILAQLINKVYSVERIKPLSDKARKHLKLLELNNVELNYGDGHWGWAKHAPYQSIIVTASPDTVPEALLDQLAIRGCLIIPVGEQNQQVLLKIVRTRTHYEQYTLEPVSFVPLREGLN